MSDNVPNPDLSAVEASLKGLVPTCGSFDRDALFFRAGQATAASRTWPITTAVLAMLCVTLGTLLAMRPEPPSVERLVYVQVPAAAPDSTPVPETEAPPANITAVPADNYLHLRQQVLRFGVDALPEASFPAGTLPARPTTLFDLAEPRPAKS